MTPGKVTPTRCSQSKAATTWATTPQTASGSDGCGVSIRTRLPISSPLSRSTGQPLIPLPPMSTPKPRATGHSVVIGATVESARPPLGQDRAVTSSTAPRPTAAELLGLAVATAREAAAVVARGRGAAGEQVEVKSSPVDMVTTVDRASEELVVGRLLGARPDDGLLGEEGGERAGTSGVRWIVDPIDGTTNFVYGLPAYAVSIAAEVDGRVQAGVVLNVATGELFTATLGGGAQLSAPGREPEGLRCGAPTALEQTL